MFPTIIRLGEFAIHTYGLLIATGILVSFAVLRRELRRVGVDEERTLDALFWGIVAGIIGSRMLYVAYFPGEFRDAPLEALKIWKGGLVFQGGIAAAVPTIIWCFRRWGIPVRKAFDSVVIVLPLGHFFGRLGCLAAGCCFGAHCDLPWAVVFDHPESIAPRGIPLHPTQVYEALLNLTLFAALLLTRRRTDRPGLRLGLYLAAYGCIRLFVEFFRGDDRIFYAGLSSAQWISVLFAVAGLFFIGLGGRNRRQGGA